MTQRSTEISDKVTLLVFKDNYAARTFHIPLNWISKFGLILGILVTLCATSSVIAFKYYRIARKTDPVRVQDLEQELAETKAHYKLMEAKANESAAIPMGGVQAVHPAAPTSPITVPLTPVPPIVPSIQENSPPSNSHSALLFSAFPPSVQTVLPDPSTLPISILTPKAVWKGNTLKVRFALQYVKTDQGTQQGRILILARGPEQLVAYPVRCFNRAGEDYLISPEKGELFSVSRYREVKADFPVSSANALRDVEIFIFNKENQLLMYQKFSTSKDKPESPTSSLPHSAESSPDHNSTGHSSGASSDGNSRNGTSSHSPGGSTDYLSGHSPENSFGNSPNDSSMDQSTSPPAINSESQTGSDQTPSVPTKEGQP